MLPVFFFIMTLIMNQAAAGAAGTARPAFMGGARRLAAGGDRPEAASGKEINEKCCTLKKQLCCSRGQARVEAEVRFGFGTGVITFIHDCFETKYIDITMSNA